MIESIENDSLVKFFEILIELDKTERARKERLKSEPKGFPLEDGQYTCFVCATFLERGESWYDEHGIKCMRCQNAFWEGVIPAEVFNNKKKNLWYSLDDLKTYYGLHHSTARRLVREGKLKARIIKNKTGRAWHYLFLVEENKEVLQPKPPLITRNLGEGRYSIKYPQLKWTLV